MTSCDLVHNMCGWFIQFTNGDRMTVTAAELGTVTESQAINAAHDLGFDEMAIWDYERHIKDVVIPKRTLEKQSYVILVIVVALIFTGCESYYRWQYQTCVQCDLPIDCHGNQRGSPQYKPCQ